MTTMPAVKPGEPICHLALPDDDTTAIEEQVEYTSEDLDGNTREQWTAEGMPHLQVEADSEDPAQASGDKDPQ